jgi:hypothetical protein
MWSVKPGLTLALVLIVVVWRIIAYSLQRLLVRKFTVTRDLEHLGKARLDEQRIRGNAVVCGGRYVLLHRRVPWGTPLYHLLLVSQEEVVVLP